MFIGRVTGGEYRCNCNAKLIFKNQNGSPYMRRTSMLLGLSLVPLQSTPNIVNEQTFSSSSFRWLSSLVAGLCRWAVCFLTNDGVPDICQ